ncbi:MAG: hypothetical protein JSW55_12720 [Chloroflexota bacterium]|nr:MAG: hypothetical protein JSW55_12720 [Chloroflexota bacterium]
MTTTILTPKITITHIMASMSMTTLGIMTTAMGMLTNMTMRMDTYT